MPASASRHIDRVAGLARNLWEERSTLLDWSEPELDPREWWQKFRGQLPTIRRNLSGEGTKSPLNHSTTLRVLS
jgi:hypothetical protein